MTQVAPLLVLAFLAITFLQSGYDKIKDWKGNVEWLNGHFSNTVLAKQVPFALGIVLLLEIVSGVLCVSGIIQNIMQDVVIKGLGFYGAILSCVTLLFLLFGQRLAKDYDGARTIVIYFIPAVMLVNWLS
ncbi:DoxX family protein [Flavobacterium sp. HXWNR29]|uniref:DoxX family membrane protein n=1 Tax=Flavobacterium odoriferum TaxID=2946604 RepID=UPI0021CB398F|nr:DoxX family membrane protein [Flavobacterium sp. HXWNR29]MCU4187943.1 DoxX family protein [Flavobacterium sp. HXWNR29]